MTSFHAFCIAQLSALIVAAQPLAAPPSLTTIPTAAFTMSGSPKALSRDGAIAVGSAPLGQSSIGAYVDSTGALIKLPNTNRVSCISADASTLSGVSAGKTFRWRNANGLTLFSSPGVGENSPAGISGTGNKIFVSAWTQYGNAAFIMYENSIGGIGVSPYGYGIDVSEDGQWGIAASFQGGYYESIFRCTGDGGGGTVLFYRNFGVQGPPFSPCAINSDGSVIVGGHARWVDGRGRIPFTRDPSAPVYYASSVSGDGTVAVGMLALPTGYAAHVWREGRGIIPLNEFLAVSGFVDANWCLTSLTCVSSDGSALAGLAYRADDPKRDSYTWIIRGLTPYNRTDFDGDGSVTTADLSLLLLEFGDFGDDLLGDLDRDGEVSSGDVAVMLLRMDV